MGRDHTLFALIPGWVQFYRPNPEPLPPQIPAHLPGLDVSSASASAAASAKDAPPPPHLKPGESPARNAHQKELPIKPLLAYRSALPIVESLRSHPSSARRNMGRRYIGVTPSPDVTLPSPIGAPRERIWQKVDVTRFDRFGRPLQDVEHVLVEGSDDANALLHAQSERQEALSTTATAPQ